MKKSIEGKSSDQNAIGRAIYVESAVPSLQRRHGLQGYHPRRPGSVHAGCKFHKVRHYDHRRQAASDRPIAARLGDQ